MRRPTDGDAAYQLRLARRALRTAATHLRAATLDAAPRTVRVWAHWAAIVADGDVAVLEGLINEANAHVRQLVAKRKAET